MPGARPLQVWLLQPRVHHYRTPVFDGVRERGLADGAYELTVLGTYQNGKAFGGEARAYHRSMPREDFRVLGMALNRWPAAIRLVEKERPAVVVMEANIRNATTWRLPEKCRSLGIATVGWSKYQSVSAGRAFVERLKPWYYGRFDRLLCYGVASLDGFVKMGYPRERITVARNTIDTRKIFREGDQIQARAVQIRRERGFEGKKILLSIGRMDPDKRHADLLDAWPRLRALDPGLVMALLSGGPLLEEIRARAAAVDSERILVTGAVPEGDDYAWIAASDLCVYPGAVGLAVNQSLALGRPTLVADEPGADTEIVIGAGPGQTGWRFQRGSTDDLVQTVRRVLESPDQAAEICARGRVLMRDEVTIEKMIDAIDGCIRQAIETSSSGRLAPVGA